MGRDRIDLVQAAVLFAAIVLVVLALIGVARYGNSPLSVALPAAAGIFAILNIRE
ncbi:hypothetical protein [Kineosporia sp. NBRC 101731]|uniref:hypothetical protein n=1 Tax=Kineosporia sp. NBRC 101731 TaxID=3032199 RepID=UPI0024A22BC1|nr:hypothetical protein [Kineosporia sp. NBRC 101731]GLY32117.1 hypothetical protein Kisp02_54820 [Kineosporia sp. NBRC 101731]